VAETSDTEGVNSLSSSQLGPRATRAHFAEPTTAVLRFKDGRRIAAKLRVVSLTGGLLALAHPIDTGCNAKLMFLTGSGMVLGAAEMLSPRSWTLQPFRFVGLNDDDQARLKAVIQMHSDHGTSAQIERSRAW
jgi:hypothetical protein